jgi:hypothetical protein
MAWPFWIKLQTPKAIGLKRFGPGYPIQQKAHRRGCKPHPHPAKNLIHHSQFIIHHSPFIIHHSPFIIRYNHPFQSHQVALA